VNKHKTLRLNICLCRSGEDKVDRIKGVFKYDMCWQKRGSGRSYDSLTDVGTMIGNETGKVVGYGVRSKHCRVCDVAKAKGLEPSSHDCQRNWSGSSKAMEPDAAVSIVQEIEQQGIDVATLIMDDDATTIARLRKAVSHDITKWSDTGHTKKHVQNALYTIAKNHKQLTAGVIKAILRWFSYAMAQNKGNAHAFKMTVNQIVPHAFGDHENCVEHTWCTYSEDPENFCTTVFRMGRISQGTASGQHSMQYSRSLLTMQRKLPQVVPQEKSSPSIT
jgi:hypothetical protein